MPGHFLSMLDLAAIGKVGGNPGCPERVAADRRGYPGCDGFLVMTRKSVW
jgi:hypothetical protein